MIVLCLHPFTPHPDFFPPFLSIFSAHRAILSQCLLSVCVCFRMSVHVRVPPEDLLADAIHGKTEKAEILRSATLGLSALL